MSEVSEFLTAKNVTLILGVAIALVQCFLGYRLRKVWAALAGVIVGYGLAHGTASVFLEEGTNLPVLLGVFGAVLLGFLSFRLYRLGVFVFCGMFAFAFAVAIQQGNSQPFLSAGAFWAAGILGVKWPRITLITVTAVGGSICAVDGVRRFLPMLEENPLLGMGSVVLLAVLALAVQCLTSREKK